MVCLAQAYTGSDPGDQGRQVQDRESLGSHQFRKENGPRWLSRVQLTQPAPYAMSCARADLAKVRNRVG